MTLLPTPAAVQLAVSAIARQGQYGAITELAQDAEVSRPTVYAYRDRALQAIQAELAPPSQDGALFTLPVHRADLERSVIAMRVVAPCSTRDIEDLLPILYPHSWSHGTLHSLLAEAEEKAAAFNKAVDLAAITHGALDEMFSQGQPVFGGIDLDYGYLFALAKHPDRSGETWTKVLTELRDTQNLQLSVVTKDAGAAMTQAIETVYGGKTEQRDDLFHLTWMMGKTAWWLEQRAYTALESQFDWEQQRDRVWKTTATQRRAIGQHWRQAKDNADAAITRYDSYQTLRQEAIVLLEPIERQSGRLRSAVEIREGLESIADRMTALGGEKIRKVATYLKNRASGLSLYLAAMAEKLKAANEALGLPGVAEAVVWMWQSGVAADAAAPCWDQTRRREELKQSIRHLLKLTGRDPERLLSALQAVMPIVVARHRASSAIENLNSVLRPYLVVQKGAHSGFLELFRFWWNTRTRRWGRHTNTSAYELLTGRKVEDWLSLLGYPPSPDRAALAA